MKKVLVNFASPQSMYTRAQTRACEAARALNYFDLILPCQATDLGRDFHEKHQDIFRHERGYGYWIWKPYVILKTLQRRDLKAGDIVFYCDADFIIKPEIDRLFDKFQNQERPVLGISQYFKVHVQCPYFEENKFTKQDVLYLFKQEHLGQDVQAIAFQVLFKVSEEAVDFCQTWYEWMGQEHVVAETESYLRVEAVDPYEHRHDQSVFSLLLRQGGYGHYALLRSEGDLSTVHAPSRRGSLGMLSDYFVEHPPEYALPWLLRFYLYKKRGLMWRIKRVNSRFSSLVQRQKKRMRTLLRLGKSGSHQGLAQK